MLKKLLPGSLLLLVFILSCGSALASPAASGPASNQQDAVQIIEKANRDIENKIAKAVEQADRLQESYLSDVKKIRQSEALNKLNAKLSELSVKYIAESNAAKKAQIASDIAAVQAQSDAESAKVEAELAAMQQTSDELIDSLFSPQGTSSVQAQQKTFTLQSFSIQDLLINLRTQKYTNDLNTLIRNLYNETLNIADQAIARAAKLGVTVERHWELVTIGDRQVWIDPISVTL